MDSERNGLTHGRSVVGGVESLVVEAVPHLVHDPEECVGELIVMEAAW